MKKAILITCITAASFGLGFAFSSALHKKNAAVEKVTGIGGIFFKCKDPKKMTEWYKTNLGLNTNSWGGATLTWHEDADSTKKAQTQWQPFPDTTSYFRPSAKDYMIDYRVGNLEAMIKEFKSNGVTIVDTMETYDFGKFIHILDAEGNKIELWEPKDK